MPVPSTPSPSTAAQAAAHVEAIANLMETATAEEPAGGSAIPTAPPVNPPVVPSTVPTPEDHSGTDEQPADAPSRPAEPPKPPRTQPEEDEFDAAILKEAADFGLPEPVARALWPEYQDLPYAR